jgi:hypothetical protein
MLRIVLFTIAGLAIPVFGQGKGNAKGKPQEGASGVAVSVAVIFSEPDRGIIRDWVRSVPPSGLPPGLAKRGELPPGLQKQLRKKGTLPPGLEKKISPFPPELVRRLRPLPRDCGCDRIFLDGRALIIARATSAILDVMELF